MYQCTYNKKQTIMKKKKLVLVYMDGYDEVRDLETQEVVFSTKLPECLVEYVDRITINREVVDNVVNIWNKTGEAELNLGSGGDLDEYLLNEGECTQDEREIVVEGIFDYIKANNL